MVAPALGRRAVEVGDRDALAGDRHDLVLAELERLAGVLDEGGDVGAEEVLALAEPDDQRASCGGRRRPRAGSSASTATQRERALEAAADRAASPSVRSPAASTLGLEQVGGDLGVGLGDAARARRPRSSARSAAKFSMMPLWISATPAVAAEVRVGVGVGGAAVGGPAGVPDAGAWTPAAGSAAIAFSRLASLPARLPVATCRRRRPARRRRSRSRGTPAGAGPRSRRPAPCRRSPDVAHDSAHGLQSNGVPGSAPPGTRRVLQQCPHVAARQRNCRGHGREPSPYVELDRAAWAALRDHHPLSRSPPRRSPGCGAWATRSTSTRSSRSTCRCPACSACTSSATERLHRPAGGLPAPTQPPRTPFVIGLAGSVAVGKSTTARVLQQLLAHWPEHPPRRAGHHRRVPLPQRRARAPRPAAAQGLPGVLRPPRAAAVRRRRQVRRGRGRAPRSTPTSIYDVVPDEQVVVSRPDIADRRGPQRAAAGPGPAPTAGPAWPSATSSTSRVYVDARRRRHPAAGTSSGSCGCARRRSATPRSYFHRYAALSEDEARATAERIWDTINGPNLSENVLPTRARATLVLCKGDDHSVRWVRLRKL